MGIKIRAAATDQQTTRHEQPPAVGDEFTALQRERVIRGAISTQAMEGIDVPNDVAVAAFESALRKPLPQIE